MGDLNCSAKVSKLLLTMCNLVVMLAGVALLATGIWFVADPNSTKILKITESGSATHALVGAAGGIVIVSGFFLFLVGLIGFYGALSQRTGCLNCFSAILIILVLLQVVAAIMAGVFHTQITNGLTESMNSTMKLYQNSSTFHQAWDFVQCDFKCCGIKNASDWNNVHWKNESADVRPVPPTCCALSNSDYMDPKPINTAQCYKDATSETKNTDYFNYQGCEQKFEQWVAAQMGPLIGIAIAVVVIELVGITLSCVLSVRIKRGYEYV